MVLTQNMQPLRVHILQKHRFEVRGYFTDAHGPNISTTLITAMRCWQCLYLIVDQVKGKHYKILIAVMGVVDTFGHGPTNRLALNYCGGKYKFAMLF